jgi:NADH-quinone oxidoreductase subunit L
MTAFYMFRLYYLTFHGTFRGTADQAHHLHESPPSMIVPLQVLAIGSVFAGYAGVPAILWGTNWIERFLHPVFEAGHHALEEVFRFPVTDHDKELGLMLASVGVAVTGWFLARQLYKVYPSVPERIASSLGTIHRVLLNKYYVDELYGKVFVRGLALGGGSLLHATDRFVVDGGDGEVRPGLGVNGLGWLCRDVAAVFSNAWDRVVVDGLVNAVADILDNVSYVFRAVQNGLVQHYALAMLIGVFLLIGAGHFMLSLY